MASGFSRLLSAADDLVLDIPDAVHLLSLFLGRCVRVLECTVWGLGDVAGMDLKGT